MSSRLCSAVLAVLLGVACRQAPPQGASALAVPERTSDASAVPGGPVAQGRATQAENAAPGAASLLAEVRVAHQPERRLRVLAPQTCDEKREKNTRGCPFEVVLLQGQREVARKRLDWALAVGPPQAPQPAEPSYGAGDPLQPSPLEARVTGEESTFVATVSRFIGLGPEVSGLLLDQAAGFEHLKRAHRLFVPVGDTLAEAWNFVEGDGPAWSSTGILPQAAGRELLVLFHGLRFTSEYEDRPDELRVQVHGWDGAARQLVKVPVTGLIHAAVLGPWPTVKEARRIRAAKWACLAAWSIVPAEQFELPAARGVVLAQVSTAREAARSALHAAKGCATHAQQALTTVR